MALTFLSADDTRISPGLVSASTLLGDSTSVVKDWTRPNDIAGTALYWKCIPQQVNDGHVIVSIDGSSGLDGFSSGVLKFAHLTPQMAFYVFNTVLAGQYTNDVTISVFHPVYGQSEYTAKMAFPSAMGQSGQQQNASIYTNVEMRWFRGTLLSNSWDDSFDNSFG